MNHLITKYKVNEEGMIEKKTLESELDDIIRSIQETNSDIEKLIFEKKVLLSKINRFLI